MKKIIAFFLTVTLLLGCSNIIFAAMPPEDVSSPMWNNITTITNSLNFDGTLGYAGTSIFGKPGTEKISATYTVYKLVGDNWEWVDTTSTVTNDDFAVLHIEFEAEVGYEYKAALNVTVYRGGFGESFYTAKHNTCTGK